MAKTRVKTEVAVDDFFAAAKDVRIAQSNFDNAVPEYFDIANEALTIAKQKYELAGKRVKLLNP